jgi:hypothetical protein
MMILPVSPLCAAGLGVPDQRTTDSRRFPDRGPATEVAPNSIRMRFEAAGLGWPIFPIGTYSMRNLNPIC